MQVSRKAFVLVMIGLVALVIMIGGYCSMPSNAADSEAGSTQAGPQSDAAMKQSKAAESQAWFILSQTDTVGLLLGLPEQLGKTIASAPERGPVWDGVENGGRLTLDVQVEGDAKGEIIIGFFTDPKWWLAEPVQVRRVRGPGRYTFDRLIPGKYRLGAVIGAPPKPLALGVHATWPMPVEITAGRTAEAHLLVSTKFQNHPAGIPGLEKGFAGQWKKTDPSRLITVRNVDAGGKPVPFGRVTFVDRGDGSETLGFHEAGADGQGYAYCDKINWMFSLCVQRFDILPERLGTRYEYRKMAKLYDAKDRPVITVNWDRFPAGTAKLVGRVHDQNNRPLTQYYLTLTRNTGEQHDWSDANSYSVSLPIIDPQGQYEVAEAAARYIHHYGASL